MSYLFDSSALLNIVKRRKARTLAGHTIYLAFYEIVNAVWKETFLVRSLPEETALELLRNAITAWRTLPKVEVEETEVFAKAKEYMVTAYDAAYLAAALKNNFVLVTDDSKLRSIERGISSQDYIEAYGG